MALGPAFVKSIRKSAMETEPLALGNTGGRRFLSFSKAIYHLHLSLSVAVCISFRHIWTLV